jgi:hypothetical protein
MVVEWIGKTTNYYSQGKRYQGFYDAIDALEVQRCDILLQKWGLKQEKVRLIYTSTSQAPIGRNDASWNGALA